MLRPLSIALSLLCLTPAAQASEELGLWDAAMAMTEPGKGDNVSRMDAMQRTLSGFASNLVVDEESLELMRTIRDTTLQLNLKKLYEVLPEAPQGETRRMRSHGETHGVDGYDYTLFPFRWGGDGTFGSLDTSTTMTPVEQNFGKGDGFAIGQEGRFGMGPIAHNDVARLAERTLTSFEWAAKGGIQESALGPARRLQPNLSATTDLALLSALNQAFPAVVRAMSQFLVVDRIGTVTDDLLVTDLRVRLNTEDLKGAGYSDLGKYASRIGDLIMGKLTVTDFKGQPLVTLKVKSSDMSVRLSFVAKDGALIPRKDGVPQVDQPIRPTDAEIDVWLAISSEFRAEGVLLRIYDYAIPVRYRSREGGADVLVSITDLPKIDFTGTNKFTSFFAEIADSALNLETHGQIVFRGIAEGQDGKGTQARIRYTNGSRSTIAMSTDLLLVDNPLIGFGLKIVGNHLSPNDEVVADAMHLVRDSIAALDADYVAMRPRLAATDGG